MDHYSCRDCSSKRRADSINSHSSRSFHDCLVLIGFFKALSKSIQSPFQWVDDLNVFLCSDALKPELWQSAERGHLFSILTGVNHSSHHSDQPVLFSYENREEASSLKK